MSRDRHPWSLSYTPAAIKRLLGTAGQLQLLLWYSRHQCFLLFLTSLSLHVDHAYNHAPLAPHVQWVWLWRTRTYVRPRSPCWRTHDDRFAHRCARTQAATLTSWLACYDLTFCLLQIIMQTLLKSQLFWIKQIITINSFVCAWFCFVLSPVFFSLHHGVSLSMKWTQKIKCSVRIKSLLP